MTFRAVDHVLKVLQEIGNISVEHRVPHATFPSAIHLYFCISTLQVYPFSTKYVSRVCFCANVIPSFTGECISQTILRLLASLFIGIQYENTLVGTTA